MLRLRPLIYPSRYISRTARFVTVATMATMILADIFHRYIIDLEGHALYGAALAQSIAIWGVYALLFDATLPGLGGQFEANNEPTQYIRFYVCGPTFLVTYIAFFFAFR